MKINNLDFSNHVGFELNKLNQPQVSGGKFSDFLLKSLESVNSIQKNSENMGNLLALGQGDNIHEVMLATEKADIALQLTLQVRNKVMEAYQEIMRMQI